MIPTAKAGFLLIEKGVVSCAPLGGSGDRSDELNRSSLQRLS
jgi:hypothetical protein